MATCICFSITIPQNWHLLGLIYLNYFISDLYKCTECEKAYKSREGLNYHLEKHHQVNQVNKEPTQSCDQCGLTFTSRRDLLIHIRYNIRGLSFLTGSRAFISDHFFCPLGAHVNFCPPSGDVKSLWAVRWFTLPWQATKKFWSPPFGVKDLMIPLLF